MHGQMHLRDLDILLEMKKRQLQLCKLLFRYGNTHLALVALLVRGPVVERALRRNVAVEPGRNTPVHKGVQAIIRRRLGSRSRNHGARSRLSTVVGHEQRSTSRRQLHEMELCADRRQAVEGRGRLDESESREDVGAVGRGGREVQAVPDTHDRVICCQLGTAT